MAIWPFSRNKANEAVRQAVEQKSYSLPELLISANRAVKYNNWDIDTAIKLGYKANAAFFACARIRAESSAEVPWRAMRKLGDGTFEHMPDSDLQRLIDNPNPDIDFSEMVEHMINSLDIAGNEYWTIVKGGLSGRKPIEIWPLDPRGMAIQGGEDTRLIKSYKYTAPSGGKSRPIDSDDIVHIKNANPESFLFGMPTVLASGRGVDIYREARDAQKASFENRGLHDFAVILDTNTTPEQLDRIKNTYEERASGAKNNRKPLFSTRDVKPLSAAPAEMDYINTVESVVTEICSVMGVPPSMIGYMQDATLANFDTAKKVFWENGMTPLLSRVSRQLTHQLAKQFGDEWAIQPDLSNVKALQANYSESVTNAKSLWDMGVPFNEISKRLDLGFDDVDGGDNGYLGSGLIPSNVDWSGGGEQPLPEPSDETTKILARLAYGEK